MKVWLKYLIAICLGIISSFLLPSSSLQSNSLLNFAVDFSVRFGRYALLPVLFFSIATSFFKLRDEKLFAKTTYWTFGTILVSSFALTVFGLLIALIVQLPRIPITTEKIGEIPVFDWKNLVLKLFPYSGFQAIVDGAYLLPCFVFAGLAGAGAASDKNASKQAVGLFESLSLVCYTVMTFLTEIFTLGMIFIASRWSLNFIAVLKTGVYSYLILTLTLELLFLAFIVYPLTLYFLCHEPHPYRILYASLCPFLVAFFSGDTNLSLTLSLRHGKESLGIRRRINSVALPLFSILGRGGAALVQTTCFILILRSYSSLGISFVDVLWIGSVSFIFSFALGEIPFGGPFFALTIMCTLYGRGFESGYLLIKDASPVICAYACAIDTLTAFFGNYIVAVKTKMVEHQELKKFI